MDNNIKPKKKSRNSLSGYINTCLGLILVFLAIIGATGKTAIGAFIVYSLAYLFGIFYSFILAFIFILGLKLVFTVKAFPIKGESMLWLGLILIFIACLTFGSYSIYISSENGVDFASINYVYADRMSSFSTSIWQIDTYESISLLGGGYLGLFFLSLVGSVFGKVGDAIFFSCVLVIGLFFLSFRPINYVISFFKAKRQNKVKYKSEFQNDQNHLNRQITPEPIPAYQPERKEFVPSKEASAPIGDSWYSKPPVTNGEYMPKEVNDTTINLKNSQFNVFNNQFPTQSSKPEIENNNIEAVKASEPVEEVKPQPSSNPYFNNSIPTPTPSYNQQPSFNPTPNYSSTPSYNQPTTPSQPSLYEKQQETSSKFSNTGISYNEQSEKVEEIEDDVEEIEIPKPYSQPYQANNEMNTSHPIFNPLEQVQATKPVQKPVNNQFFVEVEKKEDVYTVPTVAQAKKSNEEIEQAKINEYFNNKQQQQTELLLQKRRMRDAKKASLMQYVSDVEKSYNYLLPSDSLLSDIDDSAKYELNHQAADEKLKAINQVFNEFNVKARVVSYTIGASVTRFDVETEHGEKADKIATLTSEFQRKLNGDKSVRVETVVEGKTTSGIEVGNVAPMAVAFKEVFQTIEQDTSHPLLLPIGKDISGNIVTYPLDKMPHMLVAGTTGSGKSVLIHSIIMTVIMRTYPSQAKLLLIDPKQVEFVRYSGESHLFCPVVTKTNSAILALKKLCDEMDRRFTVLSKSMCTNIEAYNAVRNADPVHYENMPYIITIIDEFTDLMATSGGTVQDYVNRIAAKARACGIHLILATQRPSKENVPTVIKANIASRIGLSCSSQIDSRVILDENGAETLLGKGDLLFKCPGKKSLIRAQSPFISDFDIDEVLNYVKTRAGHPNYDKDFLDLDDEEDNNSDAQVEINPYDNIKDFVIKTQITSKATIMRTFQLSASKVDQYINTLLSESIICLGPNGQYVLGPAARLEERR